MTKATIIRASEVESIDRTVAAIDTRGAGDGNLTGWVEEQDAPVQHCGIVELQRSGLDDNETRKGRATREPHRPVGDD